MQEAVTDIETQRQAQHSRQLHTGQELCASLHGSQAGQSRRTCQLAEVPLMAIVLPDDILVCCGVDGTGTDGRPRVFNNLVPQEEGLIVHSSKKG